VVCDSCNNYFSREVEKPFLQHDSIRLLRFHQALPSKRGVIPSADGVILPDRQVTLHRLPPRNLQLPATEVLSSISSRVGTVILPAELPLPTGSVVSRFLAKAALETFASRAIDGPDGLDWIATDPQLDAVRNHARRGTERTWPYHVRRIYQADYHYIDMGDTPVQTIHEFDLLATDEGEWYFVLAIFGIEFVFNLGGPEIEGYVAWLEQRQGRSPLYDGKNLLV
jgi:hypothetical protein